MADSNRSSIRYDQEADDMPVIKITIFGDSGVGKTSILLRYMQGKFNLYVPPTIGVDYFMKVVKTDQNGESKTCKLQIWDVAGQERFNSIVPMFAKGSVLVVLVCDITQKLSVERIEFWVSKIRNEVEDIPILLTLNKCDKENFEKWMEVEKMSDEELLTSKLDEKITNFEMEIRKICKKLELNKGFKVSALDDINIKETFEKVQELVLNKPHKIHDTDKKKLHSDSTSSSSRKNSSESGEKKIKCVC